MDYGYAAATQKTLFEKESTPDKYQQILDEIGNGYNKKFISKESLSNKKMTDFERCFNLGSN